ncbi:hypothetical protein [Mycolicibacterium sp.]|uniref:hypothetical protein n=1 Tax=Mycolicibacterium sp. TaxID=2320850 RepID=UPI0037C502E1
MKLDVNAVKDAVVKRWPTRLGRLRTSTVVLIIAFVALSWVQQEYAPRTVSTETPAPQVVPPGFVPDPDYTWVPRTRVPTPVTTTTTPTTTSPTETPTTTEEETTSPTSPTNTDDMPTSTTSTAPAPRTTVVDPDGPGLLPPITLPLLPGQTPATPAPQVQPGQESVAPTLPR